MKRNGNKSNVQLPLPAGSLIDQFFQNSVGHLFDDRIWGEPNSGQVPVNIRETDKSFELELVAPGLNKDDFKLQVQGDMLTVSFEHSESNTEGQDGDDYLRREYRHRSFSRSFRLDDTIDANKVSAQYRDGILHVSLSKKEGAQRISRMIEVQ